MLRDQQLVEQPVRQAVRANGHGSVEIARDGSRPCAIVGDPSGFIVNLERELGRMRRHSDSSCLMMVAPDARMDMSAVDVDSTMHENIDRAVLACRAGMKRGGATDQMWSPRPKAT